MSRPLSLLFVTQFAPPSAFSAARRVGGLTKYLARHGHRVTVLTSLASGRGPIEGAARTVRTRDAVVSGLSWRRAHFEAARDGTAGDYESSPSRLASLVVPDLSLVAWAPFALLRARQLARRERFDAVITSSPPESAHFVGAALQRAGVPWVADLRDGWIFETTHPEWAFPALGRLDELVERSLLGRADLLTAVSDPITEDLRRRLRANAVTLTNGFDPDERVTATKEDTGLPADRHVLLHTGRMAFSGRSPAPLLNGLRKLREREPRVAARVELAFAGPLSSEERSLIEAPGLDGAARALGSLSREETLRLQGAADTLVVITGRARRSEATAKLYEYLAADKPILVLGEDTAAAEIVQEAKAGVVTSATDPEAIAGALKQLLSEKSDGAATDRAKWSYRALSEDLARQVATLQRRLNMTAVSGPIEWAREALARVALTLTRRLGRRLGQHVTQANVYSVIPEIPPPSDPIWSRRYEFEVDAVGAMAFVEESLAPFIREAGAVLEDAGEHGFTLWNELYEGGDTELLYAMIRRVRPKRVLELGSGFSTMVTAAACERNAREGRPVLFTAVDPAPRTHIASAVEGRGRFERRDVNELLLDRFEELEDGDILFIDTSHTVKLGSEVNRLVLEVFPRLAEGVWVHVHDIFLPYEYPRRLLVASGFFNEQYLLHAFLLGNPEWRVAIPVHALWREHHARLVAAVPSLAAPPRAEYAPSAVWLRRTASGTKPQGSAADSSAPGSTQLG